LKYGKLVVLNYCMDSSHPSLGHQFSVVTHLAENFSSVEVLTTSYSGESVPSNVRVTTIPWKPRRPIPNATRLWLIFMKTCLVRRPNFVFSHMMPLSSIAVALFTRLFKIRHVLWYAHAHKPPALRLAVSLVDVVVSSTKGSFPFPSSKLILIGQGVDPNIFANSHTSNVSKFDFIYAGRMDASKNVEIIIQALNGFLSKFPQIRLTLIGNGSSFFITNENRTWITSQESVKREALPEELSRHGTFIHAFFGSLDKVLVEAAMMKMPIISTNPEFLIGFESFSPSNQTSDIDSQLRNYFSLNPDLIRQTVSNNFRIATGQHELSGWIQRLTGVITKAG